MKSGAIILGTVVSVVLLGAAGALYLMAGGNQAQSYRTSISLARQIQQISSDWSVEVARVKADPFADFDSLAAFIPRMARLKDDLAVTTRSIPGLPERLAGDVAGYLSAVGAKEERVERFKTGYAVVRNSRRYLPLATVAVVQQAREANDELLVRTISRLSQDMTTFLESPSDTVQERLTGELQRLREASVAYPLPLSNALANLFSHAEVLLERQAPTETLFREATSGEISELTDRLAGSLEFELGRKEAVAKWYEIGLMGIFALLALFWILLAVQQRSRRAVAPAPAPAAGVVTAAAAPVPAAVPAPEAKGEDREATPEEEAAAEEEEAAGPLAEPARGGEADPDHAGLDDAVPAPAPAPDPDLPVAAAHDPESEVMQAFLADCIAESLASSTSRIASGMDRLRQSQNRVRDVLADSDAMLDLDDGADLDEELEAASAVALGVVREANAIADVAKRLGSFSHLPNGRADQGMIDVNACVGEAIAAAGAEGAATVATKLGNVPEIFASKTDIRLLLAKVIENSVHAVESLEDRPGTIKIDTARKNDEILVTIIDNGVGMTPDKRAKIFKPFYTSREGAMGLGLPLAGHLAGKYKGAIKVNSLPGQGTVTRITLPAALPEA